MTTLSQRNAEELMYKSYREMLSAEDRAYLDSRQKNWDFYNGRWKTTDSAGNDVHCSAMCKYFTRNLGETAREFQDKHKITLAMTTQFVDIFVNHIYGLGLTRDFPEPDQRDKGNVAALAVLENWIGGQNFFCERLQTTAEVTGTACVIPRFDERTKTIRLGCYGAEYITPWYDLGDIDNLVGFELEFYQDRMEGDKLKRGTYYERWDNRVTPERPLGYYRMEWADQVIAEGDNPYFPYLPLVPFRARTNPNSWYGWTQTDAVVDANQVLNEYLTEFKEIVDFQGFSLLVTVGNVAGDMPIGPKRSIDLHAVEGADAKYIQPGAPLGALKDFFDWWVTWAANQAQVPVGLVNASASQVESGYALTIRWRPFLGGLTRKRRLYAESERQLWETVFQIARVHARALKTPLAFTDDAAERLQLQWNTKAIPEDPRETREQDIHDIDLGHESQVTLYLKKHPGMSEADAEAAIKGNVETRDRLRALGAEAQAKIFERSSGFGGEE